MMIVNILYVFTTSEPQDVEVEPSVGSLVSMC